MFILTVYVFGSYFRMLVVAVILTVYVFGSYFRMLAVAVILTVYVFGSYFRMIAVAVILTVYVFGSYFRMIAVAVILTPSLPWCHLKTTHKNAKFETLQLFSFSFLHWYVKGFSSKRIALKTDVTGLETILFAGVSLHLSAQKLYWLGQWRG